MQDDHSIPSYEGKQNIQKMCDFSYEVAGQKHGIYIREVMQNTGGQKQNFPKIAQMLGLSASQFALEVGKFFGDAERTAKSGNPAVLTRWLGNARMYYARYGMLGIDQKPRRSGERASMTFWKEKEKDEGAEGMFYRELFRPLIGRDYRLKNQETFAQVFALVKDATAETLSAIRDKLLAERDSWINFSHIKAAAAALMPKVEILKSTVVGALYQAIGNDPLAFFARQPSVGSAGVSNWFSKVKIEVAEGKMTISGKAMFVEWIQDKYKAALQAAEKHFGCKVHFITEASPAVAPTPAPARKKAHYVIPKRTPSDDGFTAASAFFSAPPPIA